MKVRPIWLSVIILGILICVCLCGILVFAILPRRGIAPQVRIEFPQTGFKVALNSSLPIKLHASIAGGNLRRIQLFADSQLIGNIPVRGESSDSLWNWKALSLGTHSLTAQAISDRGNSAMDTVRVEVIESADADNDGIVDESDQCPDLAGSILYQGCPTTTETDRDGDTVLDGQDRCPDQFGLVENQGCPLPGDRDGDGIVDESDACPDTPGPLESAGCSDIIPSDRDGDGIHDTFDHCPDEGGILDSGGCPPLVSGDRDGDGITDERDSCPDIAGDEAHAGCPFITETDSDGDGIPDETDHCPDDPGIAALDGCPPRLPAVGPALTMYPFCVRFPTVCSLADSTTDTDGDGVSDINDRCPDKFGIPANDGCPILSAWRRVDPYHASLFCILFPSTCGWDEGRDVQLTINLEENLYTDQDWLAVWCYFSAQDGVWYRLPPDKPSLAKRGAQIWYLGDHRSVTIPFHDRSLLAVNAFCEALAMPFGDPVSLGKIVRLHSITDWNGTPYILWSEGGDSRFMVIYSIQCDGCE